MDCYNCQRSIREGPDGLGDHAPDCPVPELIAIALGGETREDAEQLAARLRRHEALLLLWTDVEPEELLADAGILMQLVSVRLHQRAVKRFRG